MLWRGSCKEPPEQVAQVVWPDWQAWLASELLVHSGLHRLPRATVPIFPCTHHIVCKRQALARHEWSTTSAKMSGMPS